MNSLVPFLCVGLTITSALARSSATGDLTNRRAAAPTVLVLGDSLSCGYGLRRGEAYPALLAKKAAAAGLKLNVINAGVTGGTTAGALRRLPELLRQHIDVLLVELGINDAFRGVPISQIEANLQKMIDLTRVRYPQVRIVIAGIQLPQYSTDDYITQFGAMYVEVANRNRAALVPFLLQGVIGNPALNQADLIHPNEAGQRIPVANVWPVLYDVILSGAQRSRRIP